MGKSRRMSRMDGQAEGHPGWWTIRKMSRMGGQAEGYAGWWTGKRTSRWVDRQKDIQDRWIDNKSPWARPFGASPKEPTRLELPNKVLSLSTY